jgi:[ribosomal protein S5]-alanine N-acetyltransferase
VSWLLNPWIMGSAPPYRIQCGSVVLRPPEPQDCAQWLALRAKSRAFLEPWEPLWPSDHLTEAAYRSYLHRARQEMKADEAYPFLLFEKARGVLLGGLTLSFVRRRAAQSASLGYWMGEAYAGKGIMTQAVTALCRFSFVRLNLSRIEAACLPENAASIRVLEKVGFRREGYVRSFLAIAGQRRDHLLFGCLPGDLPLLEQDRLW